MPRVPKAALNVIKRVIVKHGQSYTSKGNPWPRNKPTTFKNLQRIWGIGTIARKKETKIHPTGTIKQLLNSPGYHHMNCKEINSGHCYGLAKSVYEKSGGVILGKSNPNGSGDHRWIYWKGKHYDAEAPEGVIDWKQLPFFKRYFKL